MKYELALKSTIKKRVETAAMLESQKDESAEKCPLLPQYLEGCYCTNLISQNTEAAIRFCGGNYQECDVYKRIVRDN